MMRKLIIYVHGKGGSAAEAEHYKALLPEYNVAGFDYQANSPWEAKEEFALFYDKAAVGYDSVSIIANSIGAYFSMCALADKKLAKAYFISPIVDMEKLIADMMLWAGVSEDELCARKEIKIDFGETLSWEYLCYVRKHKISWKVPTAILYGEHDNLTVYETISAFADKIGADLTVMQDGEHWFHTDEQMKFLDQWIMDTKEF